METLELTWKINNFEYNEKFKPYNNITLIGLCDLFQNEIENEEATGEEYDEFMELRISDYLADINSVFLMQQYYDDENKENIALLEKAVKYDFMIRMRIEILKFHYSLLVSEKLSPYRNEKEISEEMNKYICDIVDVVDSNDPQNIDKIREDFSRIPELSDRFSNRKIASIITNIENQREALENFEERKKFKPKLRRMLKQIVDSLGPNYNNRYKIIGMIVNYSKLNRKYSVLEQIKMAISPEDFENGKKSLCEDIKNEMIKTQGLTVTYDDICSDVDAKKKFSELSKIFKDRDFFNEIESLEIKDKLIKKYAEKGCFAIMKAENTLYFSLSGIYDYEPGKGKGHKRKNDIEKFAEFINEKLFSKLYQWARLTDSTKRYTKIIRKGSNNSLKKEISPSVMLSEDIDKGIEDCEKGLTYGCCERKMLAMCNDSNIDKVIFSRWAPCDKCIPALEKEKGKIEVFALNKDFAEWKAFQKSYFLKYKLGKAYYPVEK